MFKRLGYFVTESSEHFSEYVPWFIKRDRPDLIERFNIPLDDYLERSQAQIIAWQYAQEVQNQRTTYREDELRRRLSGLSVLPHVMEWLIENVFENMQEFKRSHEYGSGVIHSIETGIPRAVYGNVINHGLIDNLPHGCCVEVPCLVDKNGVQPVRVGALPPQLAALMQTNINMQALTVEAILTQKRKHLYHAAMLDPHTAAELDLDQIWSLVDDLIDAHGSWVPTYH